LAQFGDQVLLSTHDVFPGVSDGFGIDELLSSDAKMRLSAIFLGSHKF
jgi:hypothetical protein